MDMELDKIEWLHQLRNARLTHLLSLIEENDNEDSEKFGMLGTAIDWARVELLGAEETLAMAMMVWDKEFIDSSLFDIEDEVDKRYVLEEYAFYCSWLG